MGLENVYIKINGSNLILLFYEFRRNIFFKLMHNYLFTKRILFPIVYCK